MLPLRGRQLHCLVQSLTDYLFQRLTPCISCPPGQPEAPPQQQQQQAGIPYATVITSRPVVDARGHTGYLTFARKFV